MEHKSYARMINISLSMHYVRVVLLWIFMWSLFYKIIKIQMKLNKTCTLSFLATHVLSWLWVLRIFKNWYWFCMGYCRYVFLLNRNWSSTRYGMWLVYKSDMKNTIEPHATDVQQLLLLLFFFLNTCLLFCETCNSLLWSEVIGCYWQCMSCCRHLLVS